MRLKSGDHFRISFGDNIREFTFAKRLPPGCVVLVDDATGKPERFKTEELATMISERVAVPLPASNWLERIDVYALMDETARKTPLETQKRIQEARAKLAEAGSVFFYVQLFDKTQGASTSPDYLAAFIGKSRLKALAAGFFLEITPSRLYRALQKGLPGKRRLTDYISRRGKHSKTKWDRRVLQARQEMVDRFYSDEVPTLDDVVTKFLAKAIRGKWRKYPKKSTLEQYVRDQQTKERLARRDPHKAHRDYDGKAVGAQAEFPLQHVQVDQTELDVWLNIYDEDGYIEDRKRPWLVSITDVCTRMFLAAVLSFERPSTYTVNMAIRQMLKPKDFLIERFGHAKGSTDGYGLPKEMTFDNGVENIGYSMRALLGDASVDMDVAPIALPEAKAIVESGFNTYNQGVWHTAPGGIPHKPFMLKARRLNPEEKAEWALEFATGVMWHWIVNVYHFRTKRTHGKPVRLWSEMVNDPMVGRSVMERSDLVDIICGTRKRLNLTGEGVLYEGHVFHNHVITSQLLASMLPKEKRSIRGRGYFSRAKVSIEAIVYPHDCSHITVIDTGRRLYVRLPNKIPIFAEGLSYSEAKAIKATDRALDQQWITEDELILAKDKYNQLKNASRAQARAERAIMQGKRSRKAAVGEEVNWTLIEGGYVEEGTVEPSIDGNMPYDVPQSMAALERDSALIPHKDQVRGAAAARKTRRQKAQIQELREAAEARQTLAPPQIIDPSFPTIVNPSEYIDAIAEDLD